MLATALWKWVKRNDPFIQAIREGLCTDQQLELLCHLFDEWVIEAQSYGCSYAEIGIKDIPEEIAIEFVKFLEENKFQGFLARTEERGWLYILISGWYPQHTLPKFDERIYQFKTENALKRKLPDYAKQREEELVFYETIENFEKLTDEYLIENNWGISILENENETIKSLVQF